MRRPMVTIACLAVCGVAGRAAAQDTLAPSLGGYVHSLGLPEIYKPYLGVGTGLSRASGTHLTSQFHLGVYRDIASPVTELLGWDVEYHLGVRDVRLEQGARAMLSSRIIGIGAGVDYSTLGNAANAVLSFSAPIRRGGILGRKLGRACPKSPPPSPEKLGS